MQIVDRILDYAIPSRAKARSAERQLAQANHFVERLTAMYEAAQTTAENENHWANAKGLSADAAADPAVRKTIRDRARYEDCNNSLCRGVVDTYVDSVYGTGPTLNIDTEIEAANESIENRFHEWCDERDVYEKGRLAFRDDLIAGEGLLLKVADDDPYRTGPAFDLVSLECDRLCDPYENYDDPYERDGIRLGSTHRPLAYFLLDQHPGDNAGWQATQEGQWYDADRVIHFARRSRPEQVHGVSGLTSSLYVFAAFRRFFYATIAAAETAASISGVLKTDSQEIIGGAIDFYRTAPQSAYGVNSEFEQVDIAKRMLMQLPAGWDISQFAAQHPNSSIEMFHRIAVMEVGRGVGMPYNVAAADSSDHNYASGRLDFQAWGRVCDREQDRLGRHLKFDLLREWYREALLIPGYLHPSCREIPFGSLWPEFQWNSLGHADPKKEAEAAEIRLREGLTTLKHELGREQKNWKTVLKQRGLEMKEQAKYAPAPPKLPAPSVDAADDRQSQETAT